MNTKNNLPRALISPLNKQIRSVLGALALLFFLGAAQNALALQTVLTFDEFPDGTVLTTQYASLGVTVSGAIVLDGPLNGLVPFSMRNLTYAESGYMSFSFNSAITGDIFTVSAYVGGPADVGLFAYDIENNLLGQAILPYNAPANMLLSVTSAGNSIARFDIHDGGASFVVDNITLSTQSTVPEPASLWLMGLGLLGLLAATRWRSATTHAG